MGNRKPINTDFIKTISCWKALYFLNIFTKLKSMANTFFHPARFSPKFNKYANKYLVNKPKKQFQKMLKFSTIKWLNEEKMKQFFWGNHVWMSRFVSNVLKNIKNPQIWQCYTFAKYPKIYKKREITVFHKMQNYDFKLLE